MTGDFYSILGVTKDASPQEIKKAFRKIARECHPDVAGDDPDAIARFKKAKQAYEALNDPVMRARYDRRGQRRPVRGGGTFFDAFYNRTGHREESGPTPGGRSGSRRRARGDRRSNDLDLDDLFGDFGFGSGDRSARSTTDSGYRGQRTPPPRPQAGENVEITLDVPAATARGGGTVTAVYYRMQRADSWRPGSAEIGLVRVQDIADIRIIPGTRDGASLVERGLGDAGAYGGPYGDLISYVRVVADARERSSAPPPEPEGGAADATSQVVQVSVVEALLGGRVSVETPQGRVRVTIPPCTSGGSRMRLRGKGPSNAAGQAADLYLQIQISVPSELDEASRRLIQEFARLNPSSESS